MCTMGRVAWHDMDSKGAALNKIFLKLSKKALATDNIPELVSIINALGQTTAHLINLKTSVVTQNQIEEIKKLLSYIPQEIMLEALKQVNEHK